MRDLAERPGAVLGHAESGDRSLALIVVDDDCHCLEANLGACRLLGVDSGEVLGHALEDFLVDDAREPFHHVWLAFRAEGGHAGPFKLDTKSAVAVNISVSADVVPGCHLLVLTQDEASARRTRAAPAAADEREPRFPRRRGIGRHGGPTSREREILRLLATGATDGQIASQLELSPATVQTHVRNAKAKLGARTRAQAVALALQRGMIRSG